MTGTRLAVSYSREVIREVSGTTFRTMSLVAGVGDLN